VAVADDLLPAVGIDAVLVLGEPVGDQCALSPARRRDVVVAAACGVFVAFMVGMAYAAVPLYSWFCKTTGFGGIPQIASAGPARPRCAMA